MKKSELRQIIKEEIKEQTTDNMHYQVIQRLSMLAPLIKNALRDSKRIPTLVEKGIPDDLVKLLNFSEKVINKCYTDK